MKLFVIFTGGTSACSAQNGVLSPDSGSTSLLLRGYRKFDRETAFETASPYFILSENLAAPHWDALVGCIRNAPPCDGVIVTHGTDTLPYTAAALGVRLGLCETPVVLVSAAYPLTDSRSNGLANFRAAVDFLRGGGERGVFVAYRNSGELPKIHRATRVLPHLPYDDAVRSLHGVVYAEIRDGRVLRNPDFVEDVLPVSLPRKNGRVLWLRVHPDMALPSLENVGAVLLEGYHSGTLPTADNDFRAFCHAAAKQEVPLYLTGAEEGFAYESKQAFAALGIRVLPPLSPATAYAVLMQN